MSNWTYIAICGSRDLPYNEVHEKVRGYIDTLDRTKHVVVTGMADGPDRWANDYAEMLGIHTIKAYPIWKFYGKPAGMIRNSIIVDLADEVVAFWDGKSKGTKETIKMAKRSDKPTRVYKHAG